MASTTAAPTLAEHDCYICKRPSDRQCAACPASDPTYYCSASCQASAWTNNPSHEIVCKTKKLYSRIRQFSIPEDEVVIDKIATALLQRPLSNWLRAFLRDVSPEKRAVSWGGTDGYAGFESQALLDGIDIVGAETVTDHEIRVGNMLSQGVYNDNMPGHTIPFADRRCKRLAVSGQLGVPVYPQDYDMLSPQMYARYWGSCLSDPTRVPLKDPWKEAKTAQIEQYLRGPKRTKEEFKELVERGELELVDLPVDQIMMLQEAVHSGRVRKRGYVKLA